MERGLNAPLLLWPVWKALYANKVELQFMILRRTFSHSSLFSDLSVIFLLLFWKGIDIISVVFVKCLSWQDNENAKCMENQVLNWKLVSFPKCILRTWSTDEFVFNFLPVVSKSNLLILTSFCLFCLYFFPLKQDDTPFVSDTDDESSWPNTGICNQTQILSSKKSGFRRTVHRGLITTETGPGSTCIPFSMWVELQKVYSFLSPPPKKTHPLFLKILTISFVHLNCSNISRQKKVKNT